MKRIISLVFTILLTICLTISFVACNDDNNDADGVVLTEGMTIDEVKEALKDVTNFTCIIGVSEDNYQYKYKWCETGYDYVDNYGGGGTLIFEGNRRYEFTTDGKNGYNLEIIDFEDYDVNRDGNSDIAAEYLESMYDIIANDFSIKNNAIYFGSYIFKDFNNTKIDIPLQYANYKTLPANKKVLEFETLTETTCKLSNINVALNSLKIPEEYEGKTVVKAEVRSIKNTLTIPTTITNLQIYGSSNGNVFQIIYLGTREQWDAISINQDWNEYATLTCVGK